MPGPDRMICAPDGVLDVADRRVDPLEGGDLDGPSAAAGDDRLMAAARLGDGGKAAQAIADHAAAGNQGTGAELPDLSLAEAFHDRQLEAQGVAFHAGLDRHHDRCFGASPAATLAAAPLAAEISIVHLDPLVGPADRLRRLAVEHDLSQLLLHFPGCRLGDPETAAQLQAGDPLLALGEQIDRLKPHGKAKLGGMEDGAGGQRDLMAAAAALDQLAGLDLRAAPAAAARADEALGPAPGYQCRPALLFGPIGCTELPLIEALLELDLVACNRKLLEKSRMFAFCTTSIQLKIVRNQVDFSRIIVNLV